MRKHMWIAVALIALLLLAACGGGRDGADDAPAAAENAAPAAENQPTGDPAAGEPLFMQTCSACHGPEGKGVEGLGKDMTTSTFIGERNDQELLEFLKVGRAPDDPLNTTGVLMPPRGGNPAYTDEQLMDIVAYVRTLHE